MRLSIISSAVVAVLVGCGGTLALIVSAARAVGATPDQTAAWVGGLCLAIAVSSATLSVWHRLPIIAAWSTPGAAVIVASGAGIGMPAAVGAFLLAAVLIILTAAFKPLGGLIARIPTAIAAAMLAGVLLRFVLAVFEHAAGAPGLILPLVALFLVVRLVSPSIAVLAVLVVGAVLSWALGLTGAMPSGALLTRWVPVMPELTPGVLIGLGVPLYLVTMASQNLPGFAVLHAAGYRVPGRSIVAVTGITSLLTAPFGAHATNLAAITASLCTGPDTHPDPAKRWMAGPIYAACYLAFAIFAAFLVALIAVLPGDFIIAVAGLALVGPLVGAMGTAMIGDQHRFAAVLTIAVTASGLTLAGIGSAFWGLVAGLAAWGLEGAMRRWKTQSRV